MSVMFALNASLATRVAGVAAIVTTGLVVSAGPLTAAGSNRSEPLAAEAAAAPVTQSATRETILLADDHPALFARAAAVRDALGFSRGSTRSGRHVHDALQSSDYDEVAEVDSSGQPLSIAQFDAAGQLLAAVSFERPVNGAVTVSRDRAFEAAQHGLAALGLAPIGQPRTQVDDASGGWEMHWDRTAAGYAVRGDELDVHVAGDGHIHSLARVQHLLASAPMRLIGQTDARNVVAGRCGTWFNGSGSGFSIQAMDLEWVGPNAAFDPAAVGEAAAPYRLAWVANVKPTGPASDVLRLVTLYVDAGDGSIIGGDVVE